MPLGRGLEKDLSRVAEGYGLVGAEWIWKIMDDYLKKHQD